MKKVFKFALVAFMAAAVAVSCKDDPKPTPEPEPQPEPQPEYTGPEQGTSAWSVIGTVLETSWDTDYVLAEADGIFVLKNLKLAAGNEFKIRENKDWTNNRGGDFAELGAAFDVAANGANIKPELDGFYDVYYNPAVEQMAICEKDGAAPEWKEPEPPYVPAITLDGNMDDWAEIAELASSGNSRIRVWKFKSDAKMVYFWIKLRGDRTDTSRTLYLAFDTDKNQATGNKSAGNCKGAEATVKMLAVKDDTPTFWNGTVEGSEINPVSGDVVSNQVVCYGFKSTEDSECYIEVGIDRAVLGLPAAGTVINVECSYDWYVTGPQELTLE